MLPTNLSLLILVILGSVSCRPASNDDQKDLITNLIEDSSPLQKAVVVLTEEEEEFPDRQGFITGHRIPLELFGADTLRRIELLGEEADVIPSRRAYVDSDDIRESASSSSVIPEDLPRIFDGIKGETDTKYYETLTSFVPFDY